MSTCMYHFSFVSISKIHNYVGCPHNHDMHLQKVSLAKTNKPYPSKKLAWLEGAHNCVCGYVRGLCVPTEDTVVCLQCMVLFFDDKCTLPSNLVFLASLNFEILLVFGYQQSIYPPTPCPPHSSTKHNQLGAILTKGIHSIFVAPLHALFVWCLVFFELIV